MIDVSHITFDNTQFKPFVSKRANGTIHKQGYVSDKGRQGTWIFYDFQEIPYMLTSYIDGEEVGYLECRLPDNDENNGTEFIFML